MFVFLELFELFLGFKGVFRIIYEFVGWFYFVFVEGCFMKRKWEDIIVMVDELIINKRRYRIMFI